MDYSTPTTPSSLSLSLVREFLAKAGYKKTLSCLYEELGGPPPPITTAIIASSLSINSLLIKNKKRSPRPLSTLIEIISADLIKKGEEKEKKTKENEINGAVNNEKEERKEKEKEKEKGINNNNLMKTKEENTRETLKNMSLSNNKYNSSSSSSSSSPFSASSSSTSSSSSYNNNNKALDSKNKAKNSHNDEILLEDVEDEDFSSPPSSSSSASSKKDNSYPVSSSPSLSSFASHSSSPFPPPSPLSAATVSSLQSLLFGSSHLTSSFTSAWLEQGFYFNSAEILRKAPSLSTGLVQSQGGPCGILAVVQAYIIKYLLFDRKGGEKGEKALCLPADQIRGYLAHIFTEIIWKCTTSSPSLSSSSPSSPRSPVVVIKLNRPCVPPPYPKSFKTDGLLEYLSTITLSSKTELYNYINNNLPIFTSPKGYGCLLLLFSCVLSRGIENIKKEDFDEIDMNQSLIGQYSYCTQELVNLLLIGRAIGNVFNGIKEVDGMKMKGIEQKNDIGFLSLHEHYENIEVGNYYKSPSLPVWVICSESHYTVLFSIQSNLLEEINNNQIKQFNLYYYDQLVKQNEEIKLTIYIKKSGNGKRSEELEPPINDCIRTKWGKGTVIDWNGAEPIL